MELLTRKPGFPTAALLAASIFAISSAYAQTPDALLSEIPIEALMQMEVQTASKFRQKSIDAPAAVSVVTAEDIKTYGYRTLGEVISSMRGVYTSYDRYFTYVGVRGFSNTGDNNTRILLLIDGIRQNDAVYSQAMAGTEFILDIDLIERVEFIPGAGSAVYGSNAFFGVLNVITKGGRSQKTEVALSAGSYGTTKGRATYARVDESGNEWLLSATSYYQHGQDLYFPAYGGTAHDLDSDRSNTLFAKMQTDNLRLNIIASSRKKQNPAATYDQAFDTPGAEYRDEFAEINGEYQKALGDGLSMQIRAGVQQYLFQGDYVYSGDPANRDEAEGTSWVGEVQFSSTQFANHNLVWGLELRGDANAQQRNFDIDPYFSYHDSRHDSAASGIYIQDEYSLSDHWILNLGLRQDIELSGGSESSTSPRLGLVYKPLPQTAVKLLYGEAFRNPNIYERFYEAEGDGGYLVNPDLKQEKIKSTELVLEHALTPTSRIVASVYRNNISDLITLLKDDASKKNYFDNIQNVRAEGVELEWTGRFRYGVQARLNMNWQSAEDQSTGEQIQNSPTRLFKANISAPFAHDRLRAGAEVQAMSSRKSWAGEAPGFALVNMTLLAPNVAKNLDLSASVYNLFDRRYYDPVGEEFEPVKTIEQNGRQFRLMLTYRL